jgi:hypothetical protein
LILQDRDIEILASVCRYKYLSTDHIYRLFFTGKTKPAMYHVLKRLTGFNFIKQERFPKTKNLSLGNLIYLTDKGAKALAREWGVSIEETGFKKVVYPIQSINHYYHKKREIDFYISLDLDLEKLPLDLIDIATDGEREIREGKQVVKTHIHDKNNSISLIPDLYFILRSQKYTSKERVFFVEIDTGKETIGGRFKKISQNSLLAKCIRYEEILEDEYWKNIISTKADLFEILIVTEKQSHIEGILKQFKGYINYPHLFNLTTFDSIENQGVLNNSNWISLDRETKTLL